MSRAKDIEEFKKAIKLLDKVIDELKDGELQAVGIAGPILGDIAKDLEKRMSSMCIKEMQMMLDEEDAEQEAKDEEPEEQPTYRTYQTPYDRCRSAVYATGNRWAIENFNATH